ncbi:hypothetical protein A9P82_11575 [Arachidicoccus ginsenosidimutans]|uniref:QcrA and Rieske domain-containing protein n=1 Tax=Arachidicoccus sp. BS20 TaxID=1850526 RepID=UPI0007F11FC4|nr:Rieske 2Fe-2S domain-containing protein [Arachidicoccus sp. BS20]ANI89870.1 hypothetical protein A9P82_11575 [Arachidicoccus sp. BS20]
MDRKDFLKKACGSCAAIALGTFFTSSLLESCKTPALSMSKATPANGSISLPLADFANSDFKLVRVSNYNYDVAVIKQSSGNYIALLLMCTHAGQALTKAGNGYLCPLHGSRFSTTGEVVKGPATDPLEHLEIKIENQNLLVKLDPDYYS